ncbi:FGGY family carbohydrate kinase [Lentisphaerota bacterium ZTH]|nr:carbohydrate kinase [Lentisphaerota bacterium]WET05695.1 FGGY family carbohydrate kinase [Lentisphaerota bacterium ZTH]
MGLYLGLDCSTQSLKATVIDTDSGSVVHSSDINFGRDLPEYRCPGGFLESSDPLHVLTPPLLWAAALDMILGKLQNANIPVEKICGISGSGQQHGSVYLNAEFEQTLSGLDRNCTLEEQLKDCFSRETSPVWMDRSTSAECAELYSRFGNEISERTGSPPIERFTGPQIRKFYKEFPQKYAETLIIHLVSSFMCSLLIGHSAPIDFGDGAGMNLLDMQHGDWIPEIAEYTAPGLIKKLPPAVPSTRIAGKLAPYFEKYGLPAGIPVNVWSGDNPSSLIGCGAFNPGTAVISLGTSDTIFAAMSDYKTDPEGCGHVFGNPAGGFMSLSCFTNGSLAREKIKDRCQLSWDEFDKVVLQQTRPGNNNNMLLPHFVPESTPLRLSAQVKYQGSEAFCNGQGEKAELARAILESQVYSFKIHSEWLGRFDRIRITGGASDSAALTQIIADVFQCPVEKFAVSNSAGLGAAMRAAQACSEISFVELSNLFTAATKIEQPNAETKDIYADAVETYRNFEQSVTG